MMFIVLLFLVLLGFVPVLKNYNQLPAFKSFTQKDVPLS